MVYVSLFLILFFSFSQCTFISTTPIWFKKSCYQLAEIQNFSHQEKSKLGNYAILPRKVKSIVRITIGCSRIVCSPDTLFFDPSKNEWIKAQNVTNESYFLKKGGKKLPCLKKEKVTLKNSILMYELCLPPPHIFYVSQEQIITHNMIPVMFGLAFIFGEGISLSGAGFGLGAMGLGLWKHLHDKNKIKFGSIDREIAISTNGGSPKGPDKKKSQSLKEKRQEAVNVAKKMGFKEVKDYKFHSHGEKVFRKGDIEISLDRDCHNGGFWKMFKRKTHNRLGTYSKDLSNKIGK